MFEHFVYIIKGINKNNSNRTKYYIGYTSNINRRIRQHNCEISGGAKATKGYSWEYCGIITNFRDHIEGLQIEWRLKFSTKKRNIIDRINSFLNYIDIHHSASLKNNPIDKKLLFYLNNDLLPRSNKLIINNSNLTNIVYVTLDKYIINHITN